MADSLPQSVIGSCLSLSEQGLEFGEGFFDRIEIGRIARQEHHPGIPGPYRLTSPWALVDVEIAPDHHIAGFKLWRQLGGDISVESLAIDGASITQGATSSWQRSPACSRQAGDKGLGMPFAEGSICRKPLALNAASPQRGHIGFNRSLVNEYPPCGLCPDRRQAMFVPFIAGQSEAVLLIVLCASMAGAEDFVQIERWGNRKPDFPRRFLPFAKGVPSHDPLNDVINALPAESFQACFTAWVDAPREAAPDIIAIDGKTSRRSHKGLRLRSNVTEKPRSNGATSSLPQSLPPGALPPRFAPTGTSKTALPAAGRRQTYEPQPHLKHQPQGKHKGAKKNTRLRQSISRKGNKRKIITPFKRLPWGLAPETIAVGPLSSV